MAYILVMRPRNRIRELRKAAGITQANLAAMTGISQPAVSQLENDTRPLTIDWMRSLAAALGSRPVDFLDQDDNPDRLSPEEREVIEDFRRADRSQRELIARIAAPVQQSWRGQAA